MDLHTSWAKTKLQNIGSGPQPSPVDIHGNTVESTDCFSYLGSPLHSSGRSTIEIIKRFGIASSVMGRLFNVWRQSKLSVYTKMRLYNALVKSVLISSCTVVVVCECLILNVWLLDRSLCLTTNISPKHG